MEIQDNISKAREIAQLCPSCLTDGINGCSECEKAGKYFGALEMAEWKDRQIQEIIDKEIDRANRYHDGNLSLIQKAASVRVVSVLSEYLGKEFPEDRFHFGFTTLD